MKAAIPKSRIGQWTIDAHLAEVSEDMDSLLSSKLNTADTDTEGGVVSSPPLSPSSSSAVVNETDKSCRNRLWQVWQSIPPRWISTSRWLLSQSLLLGINFLQQEWYRRQHVKAIERRLAEVPEFPLL
eukprot:gene9124-10073_t